MEGGTDCNYYMLNHSPFWESYCFVSIVPVVNLILNKAGEIRSVAFTNETD